MASTDKTIMVTKEFEVPTPAKEAACIVPDPDWMHLRDCIVEIRSPSQFFHSLGWHMLGVALATAIARANLPGDAPTARSDVYLAITLCAILVGAVSLLFDHLRRSDCGADVRRTLREFDRVGTRYQTGDRHANGFCIHDFLLSHRFRLIHSVPNDSKDVRFGKGGAILEGRNENENTWRLIGNKLEFLTDRQQLFSRFLFDPETRRFANFVDPEGKCDHPQLICLAEENRESE